MSKHPDSFDLTNPEGMQRALKLLKSNGLMAGLFGVGAFIPIVGPTAILAKLAYDYFTEQPESKSQQAELVSRILRAGKESGASEIEVIIDDDAGVDIGAKLPPDLGNIDIRFKVGVKSKTVIRAKYRDA